MTKKGLEKAKNEQIRSECCLLKMLKSESIVKFEAAFSHEGQLFIFLEYMVGRDMVKILEDFHGYYRESFVKYTVWRVAMGLEAMHKLGIIHRDIKIDNILCDSRAKIVLADLDNSIMLTR